MGLLQFLASGILSLMFASTTTLAVDQKPRITGTFSNLQYVQESGDLLGYELRILFTSRGYFAVVQVANGGAGSVALEAANIAGQNVSIQLHDQPSGIVSLDGTIGAKWFEGIAKFDTGTKERIKLARKKSYWD